MKLHGSMDLSFDARDGAGAGGVSLNADPAPAEARNLRISLRQWKMFHAVIDSDGFAEAASRLHVSQSSISHALAKLQQQLGVPLLTIKGRKAQITEEGKILLARSRDLVKNAVEVEELAENLRRGWGREIRLAVDPSFPPDLLMLALRESSAFPQIRLSVKEASLDQARQALHANVTDLAICTQMTSGFVGRELMEVEYVAVAHPDNPLFMLKRPIGFDDLKTQFQIALSGSGDDAGLDACHRSPRYPRPWNVSTLDWAIGALQHGIGYAWLPRHRVQCWLDSNQIRVLTLNSGSSFKTKLYLVYVQSATADPGARKFADALQSCSERYV